MPSLHQAPAWIIENIRQLIGGGMDGCFITHEATNTRTNNALPYIGYELNYTHLSDRRLNPSRKPGVEKDKTRGFGFLIASLITISFDSSSREKEEFPE